MQNVTQTATEVIDIWPYVQVVPLDDLLGNAIHDQFIEKVYRDASNRYDHVLVMTRTKNVFLVIVVDLEAKAIFGHHLLDLNEKYGLPPNP
ncbi:hypothetical protein NG895_29905 [Aeoliella sp. ICT_H6.2]|uniref:Uncharacterized protein n=2 Tax=Aeoliella straminimaris TaxID=2954799 RepID=A0A9X2JJG0_9BACT|nr:hypothetical protein [Aeoliella straminimaris]